MELAGRRCTVRRWRGTDAVSLVKYANNPAVARQLRDRFPHPYTAGDARHFLDRAASAAPVTNFAIAVDQEAVGGIGFSPGLDVERYSAEIGYWLGEPHWGRGIASEALALVTEYAFGIHGVLRLFALPFADNLQSIRVLEKAGYTREGLLKASAVKFGNARDQALYARINPGWRAPTD